MYPLSRPQRFGLAALALVTLLVHLQFGLRHGKLPGEYLSDDNMYLYQGLVLLDGFYADGVAGFFRAYAETPPHAPLMSFAVATVFALLGVNHWSPYLVIGFGLLLLYLTVFAHLARTPRGVALAALALALVLLPLSQGYALELRPEYAYSVLTALGILMVLRSRPDRPLREAVIAGAAWGCAVIVKPPFLPLSLALIGYAVVADLWLQRPAGGWFAWSPAVRRHLLVQLGVAALIALPVLIPRIPYYVRYIYNNSYGEGEQIWTIPGGVADRLLYHVTGAGGQYNLGAWLWIVLVLFVLAGGTALASRDRTTREPMGVILGAFLLIWLCFYVAKPMNPYMGGPLQIMLLMGAVHGLAQAARQYRLPPNLAVVTLVAVAGFGAVTFSHQPSRWAGPGTPSAEETIRIHAWMLDTLRPHTGDQPATVFFAVSSKLMNTHSLRWVAAREKVDVELWELRDSDNLDAQLAAIGDARFVLAAEPGATAIHGWLPSGRVHGAVLEHVRTQPDAYREVSRFKSSNGPHYLLFGRE